MTRKSYDGSIVVAWCANCEMWTPEAYGAIGKPCWTWECNRTLRRRRGWECQECHTLYFSKAMLAEHIADPEEGHSSLPCLRAR